MSGIRYLIAIVFLFAGLEDEVRAHASQTLPANSSRTPSDIITNLSSKTSVDKMTQTAPDGVAGLLAERVIDTTPLFPGSVTVFFSAQSLLHSVADDGFRTSGSSPPV